MAYKKNVDGLLQYYYKKTNKVQKIIQKDWLKEHGHKRETFPPQFFENIEEKLTPGKLGYWAYAIDGDGWIYKCNKKRKFEVGIKLKDREPVQELADIYGTSISRIDYLNQDWAPSYLVQIYGKRALHFVRLICPYMTEKRKKATQLINMFDPTYHPPKISMNFRKNSELLNFHMGMIGGFFDTEGSVGLKVGTSKHKTKKLGDRFYNFIRRWVDFTNTDLRPLRKIKKILETWPFTFKPTIYMHKNKNVDKVGKPSKIKYILQIPSAEELLFMKMFAPWILITRKREYAEKFERKKQIYKLCDENK